MNPCSRTFPSLPPGSDRARLAIPRRRQSMSMSTHSERRHVQTPRTETQYILCRSVRIRPPRSRRTLRPVDCTSCHVRVQRGLEPWLLERQDGLG
eukprot:31980-Eustigmatos_ZCMA.PRE.1